MIAKKDSVTYQNTSQLYKNIQKDTHELIEFKKKKKFTSPASVR